MVHFQVIVCPFFYSERRPMHLSTRERERKRETERERQRERERERDREREMTCFFQLLEWAKELLFPLSEWVKGIVSCPFCCCCS